MSRYEEASDSINAAFFGGSTSNALNKLQEEISSIEYKLKEKVKEYNLRKLQGVHAVSPDTLSVLEKALPGLNLCASDSDTLLTVRAKNAILRFHLPHTNEEEVNDNILYCTLPLHSFAAYIKTGMLLEMYNHTNLRAGVLRNPLYEKIENASIYSHPHVAGTSSGSGEAFKNICFGNNRFNELLDKNPLTPGILLEFIRRFHIWVTSANLGDMYGNSSSRTISLKDELIDVDETDRLFHHAQKLVPIILSGNCTRQKTIECLKRINDEGNLTNTAINHVLALIWDKIDPSRPETSLIETFQFSYALWMYAHRAALKDLAGRLVSPCIWNSIRTDIVSAGVLSADVYENQEAFISQILNAPKALKALLCTRHSTEGRYASVINQIID